MFSPYIYRLTMLLPYSLTQEAMGLNLELSLGIL